MCKGMDLLSGNSIDAEEGMQTCLTTLPVFAVLFQVAFHNWHPPPNASFCLQLQVVFKVAALGHFGKLPSFPGFLPCIQEVHMLLNSCFFPVNLLLWGCLSQRSKRTGKGIFPVLQNHGRCPVCCRLCRPGVSELPEVLTVRCSLRLHLSEQTPVTKWHMAITFVSASREN